MSLQVDLGVDDTDDQGRDKEGCYRYDTGYQDMEMYWPILRMMGERDILMARYTEEVFTVMDAEEDDGDDNTECPDTKYVEGWSEPSHMMMVA